MSKNLGRSTIECGFECGYCSLHSLMSYFRSHKITLLFKTMVCASISYYRAIQKNDNRFIFRSLEPGMVNIPDLQNQYSYNESLSLKIEYVLYSGLCQHVHYIQTKTRHSIAHDMWYRILDLRVNHSVVTIRNFVSLVIMMIWSSFFMSQD